MIIKLSSLLLFSWFVCSAVQAQNRLIDSLQNELQLHPGHDSTRLMILNDLAYYYYSSDPARGIIVADSAIELALELNDTRRLASAYNYKGLNYASMGNDSIAIAWLNKCLSIHEKNGNKRGIASALHNMGISYANLSKYAEAMDCQQRALDLCKELDNKDGVAKTLNSIGVLFLYLSDYPHALDYYFQALHIHEEMKDTFNIGVVYTNIGLVYHHALNYKKSFQYQYDALKIFEKTDNEYQQQNSLGNLGNLYADSGDISKALSYYQRAMVINQKIENRSGIASVNMNMGTAFYKVQEYDEAFGYLNKALKLYKEMGNNYGAGSTINYLAGIYMNAGDDVLTRMNVPVSKKLDRALILQREGIDRGVKSGNLEIQRDGWQNLSIIYTRQKRYEDALEAYKKFVSFRDSIFNHDKQAEITRLSMQYAFDKKEAAENVRRNQEKAMEAAALDRQKLIKKMVMAGAVLLLLTGIAWFVFYKKRRDSEEGRNEARLRAEITDTEMKALRAQINPHFIFNCLNSIGEFIHHNNKEAADYYLSKFSKLMRRILENSEQKEVSLKDELQTLELYMKLEAMRLNQKFSFQIKVADGLDSENIMVPPLLIQPYVENSIWHGIAPKEGRGNILIDVRQQEDMIHCVVEDDGAGQIGKPERNKGYKSLGTQITSSRILLLNKVNKSNASVRYQDKEPGRRVEIKLPLNML